MRLVWQSTASMLLHTLRWNDFHQFLFQSSALSIRAGFERNWFPFKLEVAVKVCLFLVFICMPSGGRKWHGLNIIAWWKANSAPALNESCRGFGVGIKGIAGWGRKMDSNAGARNGIAENDKKLLSNTTFRAVYNINSPRLRSGLFVLPCKCISFKTCHSNISPSSHYLTSQTSPALTAFHRSFIAFLTILASFHSSCLLCAPACLYTEIIYHFYFISLQILHDSGEGAGCVGNASWKLLFAMNLIKSVINSG